MSSVLGFDDEQVLVAIARKGKSVTYKEIRRLSKFPVGASLLQEMDFLEKCGYVKMITTKSRKYKWYLTGGAWLYLIEHGYGYMVRDKEI